MPNALGEPLDGQQLEMEVWVRDWGELLLYESEEAEALGLVYPYCISAGFAPGLEKPDGLDGQRITVRGTVLEFERAADQPGTISTMTVIDGMWFKNWCFGSYVFRIEGYSIH